MSAVTLVVDQAVDPHIEPSSNFASTAQEFWDNKPEEISSWAWLFHPLNQWRFALWVAKLLNKIIYYSRKLRSSQGFTFFFQKNIAKWLGISEQWLREILRRLKIIGLIEDRKIRKNRQYRVVDSALAAAPAANKRGESCGENRPRAAASPSTTEQCGEPAASYMQRHDQITNYEGSIIKGEDGNSDPIVQTFQEVTGTTYKKDRDAGALTHLRQFPQLIVIAGILISRLRCAGQQINSLAYCIPAVQETAKAQGTLITNEVKQTTIARTHMLSAGGLLGYVRYLRQKLQAARSRGA